MFKNIVGSRLRENVLYNRMHEPEGKRCWTLLYDEFHIDILPSSPRFEEFEDQGYKQIRLTHKEDSGKYTTRYSNPQSYKEWFEDQMRPALEHAVRAYASMKSLTIDDVPLYKVRTPLQRSIQILKRHRDIYYNGKEKHRKKSAPISIVITTLAALAYNNQDNIYDTLECILNDMEKHIEIRHGKYWVQNPVLQEENFADKWNVDSEKAIEFFARIEQARKDILLPNFEIGGIHELSEILEESFGESAVRNAIVSYGERTREMRERGTLKVSTLNSAGVSFENDKNKDVRIKDHTFYGK